MHARSIVLRNSRTFPSQVRAARTRSAAGVTPSTGLPKRPAHAATNAEAFDLILRGLGALRRGLLFANVIEFDQTWGHRNDVAGFARGLAALDRWIPKLRSAIGEEDLVILTADHGNDPTTPSTDHSRERVPILVLGGKVNPVGIGNRSTFADVGQTVAEFLGVPPLPAGTSFLREVWSG